MLLAIGRGENAQPSRCHCWQLASSRYSQGIGQTPESSPSRSLQSRGAPASIPCLLPFSILSCRGAIFRYNRSSSKKPALTITSRRLPVRGSTRNTQGARKFWNTSALADAWLSGIELSELSSSLRTLVLTSFVKKLSETKSSFRVSSCVFRCLLVDRRLFQERQHSPGHRFPRIVEEWPEIVNFVGPKFAQTHDGVHKEGSMTQETFSGAATRRSDPKDTAHQGLWRCDPQCPEGLAAFQQVRVVSLRKH